MTVNPKSELNVLIYFQRGHQLQLINSRTLDTLLKGEKTTRRINNKNNNNNKNDDDVKKQIGF